MRSKLPLLLIAALMAALVAVGCGGDSDESGSAAAPKAASAQAEAPAEQAAAEDGAKSASKGDAAKSGKKKSSTSSSTAAETDEGTPRKGLTQAEMKKAIRAQARAQAKAKKVIAAQGKALQRKISADEKKRLAEYREGLKSIRIGPSALPAAVKKACKTELRSAPASGTELANAVNRAVAQLTKLTSKGSPALHNMSGDIVALRQATAVLEAMRGVVGPARSGDSGDLRAALNALEGVAKSNGLKTCAVG